MNRWLISILLVTVFFLKGKGIQEGIFANLWLSSQVQIDKHETFDFLSWREWLAARGYVDPCKDDYFDEIYFDDEGNVDQGKISSMLRACTLDRPYDDVVNYYLADSEFSFGDRSLAANIWEQLPAGRLFLRRAHQLLEEGSESDSKYFLDLARKSEYQSNSLAYDLAQMDFRFMEYYLSQGEDIGPICLQGKRDYEAAIFNSPNFGFLIIEYGRFLRSCNEPSMALKQFMRVDDAFSDPNQAWANIEAGLTLGRTGELDDAIKHFRKAVDLSPGSEEYKLVLGFALLRVGEYSDARELFIPLLNSQDSSVSMRAEEGLGLIGDVSDD